MGEKGDYIPIAIHCNHQNDSCIKTGSDGSHLNFLINCEGQSQF